MINIESKFHFIISFNQISNITSITSLGGMHSFCHGMNFLLQYMHDWLKVITAYIINVSVSEMTTNFSRKSMNPKAFHDFKTKSSSFASGDVSVACLTNYKSMRIFLTITICSSLMYRYMVENCKFNFGKLC